MLEVLGLDAEAEAIYRAMLNHPRAGVVELAALLVLPESRLRLGLDRLSEMALVLPSNREGVEFRAVSPEAAIEVLLAKQQADLAAQQSRVEEFRSNAAKLIAQWSALNPSPVDRDHEQVVGIEAIRARLARFADEAREEYATFAPGGGHAAEDLLASRGPNEVLFERGIRMRTIYLDSVRNHQPTLEHVNWLGERGGRVRTVPTLPIRMIIVDRSQAVLPMDTADTRAGAVILKGASTVAALYALFESVWSVAVPLGDSPQYDSDTMPPQERAVLTLLTQGLTNEAIAKRLGVSPRTARRIAAELMDRLHARSRFEAGVHAVQDGWLPPKG